MMHIPEIRITPAPAGKTTVDCSTTRSAEDHPRTCGENGIRWLALLVLPGSPPHLRGKHYRANENIQSVRITPAPAGKTVKYGVQFSFNLDHPRTCGENTVDETENSTDEGSPPHLRGKLSQSTQALFGIRITPAPAGKTSLMLCVLICF